MPITIHPHAELFPMMTDAELADLADDIKANGQSHNIIVDTHGRLIDGRNRLRACKLAGVEPATETRHFADDAAVLRFVISANLHRRHLSESQRAMIAARLANRKREDTLKQNEAKVDTDGPIGPSVSQTEAADLLNVGTRTVKRAAAVQRNGTEELQQAVESGEIKVSAAAQIATLPEEEQAQEIKTRKTKGKGGRPKGRGKAKPKAKARENGDGNPDAMSVIRKILDLTREALKSACSTSSASWSRTAQINYLNEVLLLIEKLQR